MISKIEIENFNKKFEVVSVFIEYENKILLLCRQDNKPQSNTWAMVAGKVNQNEKLFDAIIRETEEEIGLKFKEKDYKYSGKYYGRHHGYDFIFHIYHLPLKELSNNIKLNFEEHKEYRWVNPKDALKLDLIQDEDSCIKWFYNIS